MPLLNILIDHLIKQYQNQLPFPVLPLIQSGLLSYLFWILSPIWSLCQSVHKADPSGIFASSNEQCVWGFPPTGDAEDRKYLLFSDENCTSSYELDAVDLMNGEIGFSDVASLTMSWNPTSDPSSEQQDDLVRNGLYSQRCIALGGGIWLVLVLLLLLAAIISIAARVIRFFRPIKDATSTYSSISTSDKPLLNWFSS